MGFIMQHRITSKTGVNDTTQIYDEFQIISVQEPYVIFPKLTMSPFIVKDQFWLNTGTTFSVEFWEHFECFPFFRLEIDESLGIAFSHRQTMEGFRPIHLFCFGMTLHFCTNASKQDFKAAAVIFPGKNGDTCFVLLLFWQPLISLGKEIVTYFKN